jgi:hypothetical protein
MRPEATLVHGLVHHLRAGGFADAAAVAALGAVLGCVEGRAALLQSDGVDVLVAALRTAPVGSTLAEAATVSLRRAVEPPPPGDADAAPLRTALLRCAFEAGALEPLTAALRASGAGDSQTLPSALESMTLLGHLMRTVHPPPLPAAYRPGRTLLRSAAAAKRLARIHSPAALSGACCGAHRRRHHASRRGAL